MKRSEEEWTENGVWLCLGVWILFVGASKNVYVKGKAKMRFVTQSIC